MGTRADFYVGKGEDCEWLGSIAWDGYPDGIEPNILACTDEEVYRVYVQAFLDSCDDATLPEMGWPWPWPDSRLTDYAYTFDEGKVKIVTLGQVFDSVEELQERPDDAPYVSWEKRELYFKDMTAIQNINLGRRSGLLIFGGIE